MADWQRARLIPTSGIGPDSEAEQRATSALLAVLEVVRDLSVELFAPLGATRAAKAKVECFVEVPFRVDGKSVRPDGLVRISYGKREWTALVEVKTRSAALDARQVNEYWDVARHYGFDCVITVSNEISPRAGVHPTEGLRVRSNSKVAVHHLSWSAILSTAVMVRVHRGVDDVEQAWILGELIRYLEHPSAGVMDFDDMGPNWVQVRNAAKDGVLHKSDDGVHDVARRWDQLIRFAALRLGSEIGDDVIQVLVKAHRTTGARTGYLSESLAKSGTLSAVLRVPNTAGDLDIVADLKARRLVASIDVQAPNDRGGRARCTWIMKQLPNASGHAVVAAYPKNARTPFRVAVADLAESRSLLLGEERRDPAKFNISLTVDMGLGRSRGRKSPGFIDSVLALVSDFYENVVQDITPWVPRAPKITRSGSVADTDPHPPNRDQPEQPPGTNDVVPGPRHSGG